MTQRILVVLIAFHMAGWSVDVLAGEPGGATYQDWLKRRDAIAKDASVLRYYTFEDAKDAAAQVPNLAGDKSEPLAFKMEAKGGAPKDEFRLVDGRWPEKKAVRLDQGYFFAKPPEVAGKAFTAVLWLRKTGQGAHRGNGGGTNGMIVAVGNGYWDGWRLFTSYPGREVRFEIGRPQPSHSEGIDTASVPDGSWLHLAATWDGKEMRVYLNGDLAATGIFKDAYTQGGQLHIGYANSGVGSVVQDVDEFVFYNRALTGEELFRDAYFHTQLSDELLKKLSEANAAVVHKDLIAAERAFADLASTKDLHREMQAAFRLRQGELLRAQGKNAQAADVFAAVLESKELPASHARQATDRLLQLVRDGAGSSLPKPVFEKLLALPELNAADRISLRLSLGQALAVEGKYKESQAEYFRIADANDVPPPWRSLAQLCAGRACVIGKDYAAAKAAYEKVKTIPNGPRNHAAEAADRLAEIERLQAGKPARDPLASRTQQPKRPEPGATLYVAPDGKDTNAGAKDTPFASLTRARDEIRKLRQTGGLPAGGIAVIVRAGEYVTRETFKLTAEDSGTAQAPVIYRAADGEAPRFNAGTRIGDFKPVTDEAILKRLPDEARGKVMQSDLKAQGVADLGKFEAGGFASARGFKTHPMLELFFDGKALPFSRWPNEGYVHIADIPKATKGTFTYTEDRATRWKDEKDGWLYGYWFFDWADCYEKIASIDTDKKSITLAPPFTTYGEGGLRKGQRYCAVNMLCEIDRPGEWYLDRTSGLLYLYPPSDPAKALIEVSIFEKPVVELEGVSHITFERLTWENGRGDAIRIKDGESCLLAGCTIRKFAGDGVVIEGGKRHGLLTCDISMLGRGGSQVAGGDRKTLTPGGHFIENCYMHHLSRIDHTYTPCVLLNGQGNRIAHNLFHDSASSAMRIEGNDHLIEYNHVHTVLLESDDQGGADMWGNPTYRGNIYRFNYWHDMGNGLGCGQAGIRLDDAISGTWIYGNIFQRCADGGFGGVQIHGGKDNWIENNLFVNCKAAVSFSAWGAGRWKQFLEGHAKGHIAEVKPTEPPYVTRYPELATLYEGCDRNSIWRNVVLDCNQFLLRDGGRNDLMDNWVIAANPGYADPAKGDFKLKPDAALNARLSFQPIPFEEIGLYEDPLRK
jgi:tetratricopeptide (TPR) repeat protein